MKCYVYVTHQVPGFHFWSGAPASTYFLRNNHRHLFHIRLQIEVCHHNRAVEFFALKEELIRFIDNYWKKDESTGAYEFGESSCETIAKIIYGKFTCEHNYKVHYVEVSEDGENGAIVER